MEKNSLASLHLEKTISTSTEFLSDIWYTCSKKPSRNKPDIGNFFNNVQSSNVFTDIQLDADLNLAVFDNIEINNKGAEDQDRTRKPFITSQKDNGTSFGPNLCTVQCGLESNATPQWTLEHLLTDAFINKMMIYKVQEKKKRSYFYMQSRSLYKYLSFQIGSESIIRLRRKILEKKCTIKFYGVPLLITGSKAEGLDMSGSDVDVMMCIARAREGKLSDKQSFGFTYDSLDYEDCPGYVTVNLVVKGQTEQSYCLKSSEIKNGVLSFLPFLNHAMAFGVHGPSLSGSFFQDDIDSVPCMKSPKWPNIADEWLIRKRHFEWPTSEMVRDIVSKGCHIVPISSKSDQSEGTEWRLSFSIAEKQLIRSFNHMQILIYGLLKLVLKEIIEKEECLNNLLCSYFLKTTLFWVIEETKEEVWQPKYAILCFNLCLDKLIACIIEENCPNYFVAINNMFLGRFTPKNKERLLHVLCSLFDSGLNWVTQSSTMKNLIQYIKDPYTVFELKGLQNMKEKKETIFLILSLLRICQTFINFSQKQPKLVVPCIKKLLQIPLLKRSAIHTFCHHIDTHECRMDNKEKLACRQLVLHMILHGSEMNRIPRYSMLVSLLFGIGKFDACLQVIDNVLISLKTRRFHFGIKAFNVMPGMIYDIVDIHQTLKFFTSTNINIPIVSHCIPTELTHVCLQLFTQSFAMKYIRNNPLELSFVPEQYFYFMKCLCHMRLGDNDQYDYSFEEMTRIKVEGSEIENENYKLMNMILITALKVAKSGRKDVNNIITEEFSSPTHYSNLANVIGSFVFQGLNSDINLQALNVMQLLHLLRNAT